VLLPRRRCDFSSRGQWVRLARTIGSRNECSIQRSNPAPAANQIKSLQLPFGVIYDDRFFSPEGCRGVGCKIRTGVLQGPWLLCLSFSVVAHRAFCLAITFRRVASCPEPREPCGLQIGRHGLPAEPVNPDGRGIGGYAVDLCRSTRTYYMPNGEAIELEAESTPTR
jgi:hypothetical protein